MSPSATADMATARMHEFLRFACVGSIGFLVDAGGMELLVMAGMHAPVARVASILVALAVTYPLHRRVTFRVHATHYQHRIGRFVITNGVGASINYGVFVLLLHLLPIAMPLLLRQVSLVAGTAVALVFNYWANRRFVFRAKDAS